TRRERLDKKPRSGASPDLLGSASLHASIIDGGEELSSYPARASLQFERRTLPGEAADVGLTGVVAILDQLRREDPEFEADARSVFGRDAYEIDPSSPLPEALMQSASGAG